MYHKFLVESISANAHIPLLNNAAELREYAGKPLAVSAQIHEYAGMGGLVPDRTVWAVETDLMVGEAKGEAP